MTTPTLKPKATLNSIGTLTDISVSGGSVSLDYGRVPYAQASVTVDLNDIPDLGDVDPRDDIRAELETTDGTTTRTFDLSVQGYELDRVDSTVTFALASDEAKVRNYRTLTDIDSMVGAYALADVAALPVVAATGEIVAYADNLYIDALADSENLIRNPRMGTGITDWNQTGGQLTARVTSGGPSYSPTYFQLQAGGSGSAGASVFLDQNAISISPGRKYVLSVDVRAYGSRPIDLDALQFDVNGNVVAYNTPTRVTPGGAWTRITQTFYGVSTAAKIRPRLTPVGGLAGSEYWNVTGWKLAESTGDDTSDSAYFDGATTDTSDYDYAWAGTAHESVSRRTTLNPDAPTPTALTWFTGDSGWDFIQPLLTRYNRRLWCDENRVWRMMNPDTWTVAGTIAMTGIRTADVREEITLGNADEYATGVAVFYTWTNPIDGTRFQRVDTAGDPTQVRVVNINAAYPGPGAAAAILARMEGRGAVITVTALSNFLTTPGKRAAITVPGQATQYRFITSVEWRLDDGLMSVGTKAIIP